MPDIFILPFFKEVDKADKLLKNTYLREIITKSIALAAVGICIYGLIYSLLFTQETYHMLAMWRYEDNPHTLEHITTWDFMLSKWYKYAIIYLVYIFIKDALRYFSFLSGGMDIPKKP